MKPHQLAVLLDQRILRSLKNAGKVFHAQGIQRDDHWQLPDDLRDQAAPFEVFGLHLPQLSIRSYLAVFRHLTESEPAPPETLGDDVFKTDEGSTADEQDVRRVEGHPRLLGVLVATLRWHRGDNAFEHLQEGVLPR